MARIKKALRRLGDELNADKADLGKCRRRAKLFRVLAEREHKRQLHGEASGRALRASRHKRRAERFSIKAIYWKGRVKQETSRINHLEKSIAEREADLAKWIKEHGIVFEGHNKVRGGRPDQRLRAAIHRAALNYRQGSQPGYYSQEGASRAYDHGLFHYPHGHIWDCSTFADAAYFCCGLDSPSGSDGFTQGGYTGTEMANGHVVSEAKARSGDLVIYLRYSGDTIGHHVEVVDDPRAKTTIGHGDSAVNSAGGGSTGFNIFGDGLYEIRTYH